MSYEAMRRTLELIVKLDCHGDAGEAAMADEARRALAEDKETETARNGQKERDTNKTEATEKTHAEQNAEGHAESILELYRAFEALIAGAESVTVDGDEYTDADAIQERAMESALSVEVRGAWHTPGDDESRKAAEYQILLSTGGPACRLLGDLDEHGNAELPMVQHQDWFTPWTDYRPDCAKADDYDAAMSWFAGCFYFGE